MQERPPRVGDVLDDYCPRCRLLLNHDIASLIGDAEVAKTTCRTCFDTHDYRGGQLPARRKSKKKEDAKSLMDQVLSGMAMPPPSAPPPPVPRKKRDLWAEVERLKKK
jgi:hypothetical protein